MESLARGMIYSMQRIAVLLFGGKGERFSSDTPKQFIEMGGHPLCYYAARALEDSPFIDKVIAVGEFSTLTKLSNIFYLDYRFKKVKGVIPGGETRQESVLKALNYLKEIETTPETLILIQDGDRPNLTQRLIEDNIETAKTYGAAVTVMKATDSLLYAQEDEESDYLEREHVYRVQTPQTFRFDWIYKAHIAAKRSGKAATDDASLLPLIGKHAHLVQGSPDNLKITTPVDMEIFLKGDGHAS